MMVPIRRMFTATLEFLMFLSSTRSQTYSPTLTQYLDMEHLSPLMDTHFLCKARHRLCSHLQGLQLSTKVNRMAICMNPSTPISRPPRYLPLLLVFLPREHCSH
ncbi:hypothetical protein EV127DRAFT_429563 [Xylaria flabelliformis]|nr:hypothetical protein EV127DRAFT_429563 [Xylaria flabelliformis]